MTKDEIKKDFYEKEARKKMSKDERMSEFHKLNQWKPDWTNWDQYKDYRFADKVRNKKYKGLLKNEDLEFAWEFLRRNKDYQQDFCKMWINELEDIIFEPDELVAEKYGLKNSCLFAPWKNRPSEWNYNVDINNFEITESSSVFLVFESSIRRPYRRYADSDIALYFDERGNITEQIKEAEAYLRYQQEHMTAPIKSQKQHNIVRSCQV